jgi:hypothetical protein
VILKEKKIMPNGPLSFNPKSKSGKRDKKTASKKNGKYIIPAKAKMADTQIGIKSTEINSKIPKMIRSIILLFYTLLIKIQTTVLNY